jgi:hypothetical protein
MAAESLVQMLEEIAVGLKSGDEEIYGWLRQQLKDCGASEISVELAWGSSPGSCRKRRKRTSRRPRSTPGAGLINRFDRPRRRELPRSRQEKLAPVSPTSQKAWVHTVPIARGSSVPR